MLIKTADWWQMEQSRNNFVQHITHQTGQVTSKESFAGLNFPIAIV